VFLLDSCVLSTLLKISVLESVNSFIKIKMIEQVKLEYLNLSLVDHEALLCYNISANLQINQNWTKNFESDYDYEANYVLLLCWITDITLNYRICSIIKANSQLQIHKIANKKRTHTCLYFVSMLD